MAYSIEYFHARVQAAIEAWPVDVVADYAKIVELLIEHGPNLRLPHSRAFGGGLFELRPRGKLELTPLHGHLIVLAEGVQVEQTPYPQAAVFGAIS